MIIAFSSQIQYISLTNSLDLLVDNKNKYNKMILKLKLSKLLHYIFWIILPKLLGIKCFSNGNYFFYI